MMLDRVVELLLPALTAPDAVMVDGTLGLGGHAGALLAAVPTLRLVGVDRDPQALAIATDRLAGFGDRVRLVHAVDDALPAVLDRLGITAVQGVLLDLGVSSLQLDLAERGFAYAQDAPLDMRMDPTSGASAADVVNTYPLEELARVLREYGEERFASRIARALVRERERAPLASTARLAELVRGAVPAATRRTGGHPAKRTFQALRVEVNDELGGLRRSLPAAVARLAVGGRLVVLAYQSLEDRIVKSVVADGLRGCLCPPDLPVCGCGHTPLLRALTRGGETPGDHELAHNPRSASARLRAAEKLRWQDEGVAA